METILFNAFKSAYSGDKSKAVAYAKLFVERSAGSKDEKIEVIRRMFEDWLGGSKNSVCLDTVAAEINQGKRAFFTPGHNFKGSSNYTPGSTTDQTATSMNRGVGCNHFF